MRGRWIRCHHRRDRGVSAKVKTEVINITDCFLMLAMPGTGDDLQGIKRGIMEAADIIVINKADGSNVDAGTQGEKAVTNGPAPFPFFS